MTLSDKEHEDRIEEVGNQLSSLPTDLQQLLLLLDKAENFLSRVEQCPPQSTHIALRPSMKALVSKDLLNHSDLDVKVAVASCLSEITRITAPDAPYDDDLMKEIFGLIVGSFKNLDEMSSRSFSKRVSILETVAKVRSCVLMLDLECDDLILDMFHHFLNTIRSKHSYTVFSSMETVMTLVVEESENISGRLLSCLLDHLKIDEKLSQNIIPSAKKLAEKVLVNCALKLKPYLVELFRGVCAPLSDYSKVVASVCHGNLGTLLQNEMNSDETQADDSKFSDRTNCDELPQGSAKQDHKVCHEKAVAADAEKVVADADGSSKSVISNGTFQMGNGDSMASKQKTEFFQPIGQSRDTGGSSLTESDNLSPGAKKPDSGLNISSLKGRKRKASGKLVNNHHNQIDDKKEAPAITGRRKGRSKETDTSKADGPSFKELETAACSKPGKMNKLEPSPRLDSVGASISLHSPNVHDGTQSRKGRPPRSKLSRKRNAADKAAVDGSSSASVHSRTLENSKMTNGDLSIRLPGSNNSEVISEPEKNLLQCSASKSHPDGAEDRKTIPTNAVCDSGTNEHDGTHLTSVSLHIPNEHRRAHSRKGRPLRTKKYGKRKAVGKVVVDGSFSASVHKGLLDSRQTSSGDLPVSEPRSKKSEVICESERKHAGSAEDSKTTPTTATCDSETKHPRHRGRSGSQKEVRELDSSGQKHITGSKQQKGGGLVDDEDKEVKLKELVSSRKPKVKESNNDQSLVKDSNEPKSLLKRTRAIEEGLVSSRKSKMKESITGQSLGKVSSETKSRLKRAPDTQEAFGSKKRRKSCNGMLVGSKIRVWWPEDETFYDGLVDSFDQSSKKHRILYDDGDVEVLFLKREKWEPVEVEKKTDGVQEMNSPDVNASESNKKLKKGRRGKAALDDTKTDSLLEVADETKISPLLKSPDSHVKDESNDTVPKRKGRPPGKVHGAETPKNSSKGKDKSARRHGSNNQVNPNVDKPEKEKVGQSIKPDDAISGDKVDNHTPKSGDKVDTHTSKKRGKPKGNTSKSSIESKNIGTKSRKKPGVVNDSGIKSKKEGSPRTESTETHPQKSTGRPVKGSSKKTQGGEKPKISRKLNANDIPPNDQAKAGNTEARSTNGKKRKRGRRGR